MDLNHFETRVHEELTRTLANLHDTKTLLSQPVVKSSDCCDNADQVQQQYQLNTIITRLNARLKALNIAKVKLINEEYGYCQECGDDIQPARLVFDVTCIHCITCQTKKEMSQHLYAH
jgi:DnaK suppressor protein